MTYDHILPFLHNLSENNDREWFAENKARYEEAREEMLDLTDKMIKRISLFDPEIRYLEPRKCLFRIYRDIRFSPNKMPYKLHFGSYIATGGGSSSKKSGYYIHIQPGACMISGGIWCAEPAQLKHFRSVIDTEYPELEDIINQPDFIRFFGGKIIAYDYLKRPPIGYRADHPAIEWLKMKQWCVECRFDDEMVTSDDFIAFLTEASKAMMPFSKWCNKAMFE